MGADISKQRRAVGGEKEGVAAEFVQRDAQDVGRGAAHGEEPAKVRCEFRGLMEVKFQGNEAGESFRL